MIKRIAIAAAAGGTVFTVALASAAALDINQAAGQVGTASLVGDADGVIVDSYGFEFDSGLSTYLRLAGIDPALKGKEILIEAYTDGQDGRIARVLKTVVTGEDKQKFEWETDPQFSEIDSITIAVD